MSSYWCGYYGTALVLKADEYEAFLNRYAKENNINPEELNDELDTYGVREYQFKKSSRKNESLEEENVFSIIDILEDDCDGMRLFPFFVNGKENTEENFGYDIVMHELQHYNLYVVFSDKNFHSPNVFKKPAYTSYNALLNEFKDKMKTYLPNDFDWDQHIGSFSYAAYA